MSRRIVLLAATVALLLIRASGADAAATFTDPTGDATGGGADITQAVVSNDASGNITMSPWGSNASSGPEGMPNYGWYVNGSIPGGALVYRIGDKGQILKAGSRVSFTAKTSGTLQLAIGMMPEYSNEGYNFPGEYKAKIKVDPQ